LIKLTKEEEIYWNSLWPADFAKPKNLGLGWEMQAKYDEELKKKFKKDMTDYEEKTGVFTPPPEKPYVPSDAEEDQEEVIVKKKKKTMKSKCLQSDGRRVEKRRCETRATDRR
jgi:hypothetical protein